MATRWKAALAALLVSLGLAAAAVLYYPFELHVAAQRFALWKGGVRRVQLGALGAYERDACEAGKPCRCVALIHGLGDSSMTWSRILLGSVPRGTMLVAPDMPGTEDSRPPSGDAGYAISAQAAALRVALESRCPKWTVAGNSLGGWISARLALDWPKGVADLVLIDAAGLDDPSGRQVESGMALAYPTVEKLKEFDKRAFAHPHDIPERAWEASTALILARPTRATFLALSPADLLDRQLSPLRLPVRILWGAKDGVVPVALGRAYHRLIRGSRLEVVQDCGHLPQQECPASVVRALFEDRRPS